MDHCQDCGAKAGKLYTTSSTKCCGSTGDTGGKTRIALGRIALFVCVVILSAVTIPSGSLLRDPDTDSLIVSPFMKSLVPILLFLFGIPAVAYGIGAYVIRSDRDVAEHLGKTMSGMGYYIVLAFVASQMIAYFNWSNLGPIIAIEGAAFLQNIGLTGLPLLILFILFVALINLLIASATAKWAILA